MWEFVYVVVVELSAAHISGATNTPGGELKKSVNSEQIHISRQGVVKQVRISYKQKFI